MKSRRVLLVTTALLLVLPAVFGQESQTGTDAKKTTEASQASQVASHLERERAASSELTAGIPLKIQVVISEFDGAQKVASLPYSFNLLGTTIQNRREAHLRVGVRVPITTGANSFTYEDVGTKIDAMAIQRDDGAYRLDLTVNRSSVTVPMKGTDWKPGDTNPSTEPLIRSFQDEFTVIAKPGQTVEGTSAVDPVNGHVEKVEVTLNLAK
jgi:hypothetical protein